MATNGDQKLVKPDIAEQFTVDILYNAGVSKENAAIMAHALVLADLRGVDTHGINRLPGYLARIKSGVINPGPSLEFAQRSPVMVHLDAKHTFGFIASHMAIQKAIEMASTYGVGIVGVKNSGHYGMAATWLLQAMEKGFGCFAFTNAARSMPPWGSKEPLLGTSPFAVGLPGGKNGDFILDMSPAVVARGKIRKAERRGESILEGWALDAEGRATTNPTEALKGVVLPIGGPKGSGLAMMMDIFGGLLTGSSFGGRVNDQYKDVDKTQGVGHWFMVFQPDMFLDSKEEYLERMDILMNDVRSSEKAAGIERIYTPGELEDLKAAEQTHKGLRFTLSEIETLNKAAAEWKSDKRL
jgi:LDH2 family malate/lactate/ureidoglycolate dehydrogenase